MMADQVPITGCSGCATSAGRLGCPQHSHLSSGITATTIVPSEPPARMYAHLPDDEVDRIARRLAELLWPDVHPEKSEG